MTLTKKNIMALESAKLYKFTALEGHSPFLHILREMKGKIVCSLWFRLGQTKFKNAWQSLCSETSKFLRTSTPLSSFPPFPHPPINIKQAGRVCTMLILNYLACAMLSCAQWLFGSAHIMTLLCWNKWLANFRISVNICVSEQPDPVTYPNEEMEIESHKGTKVSLSSLLRWTI